MSWPPATTNENRFIIAIGVQESGGNYGARNTVSGALGRWQVMPGNISGWAAECGMPIESPAYFLAHPLYQDRMIQCKLGRYFQQYGARGAASVWYSGQPDWHATYGNPPVYQYVNSVMAIYARVGGTGAGAGGGGPVNLPAPSEANWAGHIKTTHQGIVQHTRTIHGHNSLIYRYFFTDKLPA